MENFILVSLGQDSKPLRESVDLHSLVSKSFEYNENASSVLESVNTLVESGYKVIVDSETPHILVEGKISDLYNKFNEKFGGTKDDFQKWYEEKKAEKIEAGTWNPASGPSSRGYGPEKSGSASPVKGVSGGSPAISTSRRTETPTEVDEVKEVKAPSEQVAKSRKMITPTRGYIRKMFANDPEGYKSLMTELVRDYQDTVGKEYADAVDAKGL